MFVQQKKRKEKMKGNPDAAKAINKGKGLEQIGNLLFIPETKEILLHNAGAKCTWGGQTTEGSSQPDRRVRENNHCCKGLM